jgi:hypothetical protein
MVEPFLNQLLVISDMLMSPRPSTVEEGLGLLSELLQKYPRDPDLIDRVRSMVKDLPDLEPRIEKMIDQAHGPTSRPVEESTKDKLELPKNINSSIPNVFISYSHKDKKFKDELVNMLAPLEDQGILKIWQDQEIRPGQEWFQEIKNAMNTCDIALLFISSDFLNSEFIKGIEVPGLLKRREEQGLLVVPIIIRPCLWQSIPILSKLQALPEGGKPIVSFEGKDKRERIWSDVAFALKNLC